MKNDKKDEVFEALKKRALGFSAKEEQDEFSADEDGNLKLTRKKVSVKEVPPELSAIKLLIKTRRDEFDDLTEDELVKAKIRLLRELEKINK